MRAASRGASSQDPLEFKGDKRGRSRQVLDSILEVLALGVTAVQLMGMAGIDKGGPPRRIEAHRINMPGNACAVPLCKWLWPVPSDSPDSSDAETVKAGFYFGADPAGLPRANDAGTLTQRPPSRILIKVPLKALVSTLEEGRSWFRSRVRTVSEDFLGRISG